MKVRDIISFSKENYYNGAVQAEWFYDRIKAPSIADSYVFHGSQYYGVDVNDVSLGRHKLIDTASFAEIIADRLYSQSDKANFILTIAGYGTGKSHLAVTLGELFSNNDASSKNVVKKISTVDKTIGKKIECLNTKRNLVIALNGMNNFNLDHEVLECARLALKAHNYDDTILRSLSKTYENAKYFLTKNFAMLSNAFVSSAAQRGVTMACNSLQAWLVDNLESDNIAFSIVEDVYSEINGEKFNWERGISAGEIVLSLTQNLCGEGKPFNKLLLLFDEFGRYIEYAAANPTIAGEAAIQQIYEAVQNSNGKAVFVGFIQADLNAYLARIDKSSNIIRYVGRYENADKFYLSSNFETVLANLIKLDSSGKGEKLLDNYTGRYSRLFEKIFECLSRWDSDTNKKGVWREKKLFDRVVVEGCYPLHPLTVWVLANTSDWMQQRSTIAFANEMFESISDREISYDNFPTIFPISIIDSSIYDEMLNSEEKGLVSSQYCMLFRDIRTKVWDRLTENEHKVLKAILIVNIARFSFHSKEDMAQAVRYCSGLSRDIVTEAICSLEDNHGIVAYDESTNSINLIAEASGFNEFKRVFNRYRSNVSATISDIDEEVETELDLDQPVETSFAQIHNIISPEWCFEKEFADSSIVTEEYLIKLMQTEDGQSDGIAPRGRLVFVYLSGDSNAEIQRIANAISKTNADSRSIILLPIDDPDREIIKALTIRRVLQKFSISDAERFSKHIAAQNSSQLSKIKTLFNTSVLKRNLISRSGIASYTGRINALCSNTFESVYPQAPCFAFDGFQKKTTGQAKKYLSNICTKLFDGTLMNVLSFHALTADEKNRVDATLSVGKSTSWKVFDSNCKLLKPADGKIRAIFDEYNDTISADKATSLGVLIGKYTKAPYGMNINAAALFTFYYIAYCGKELLAYYGPDALSSSIVSEKIFKQGKLQQNDFVKIRLQKNAYANIDVVEKTCNDILSNIFIEECPAMEKTLAEKIKQHGITANNELLVVNAKARLTDGIRLLSKQKSEIEEARTILQAAKDKMVIHKFVKVFSLTSNCSGLIEPGLPFVYSEEASSAISKLRNEADTVFRAKFEKAISELSCPITKLSAFQVTYKKAAEVLRNEGYAEQASKVEKRIEEVEKEARARQKYETLIVKCENDASACRNADTFSYVYCIELKTGLLSSKEFFEKAKDLPSSMKASIISKLDLAIKQLQTKEDSFYATADEVIRKIKENESPDLLDELKTQARNLLSEKLPESYCTRLQNAINAIIAAEKVISGLSLERDDNERLLIAKSTTESLCRKTLEKAIKRRLDEISEKEKVWVHTFLFYKDADIRAFSATRCTSWLQETAVLPSFLSEKSIAKFNELRDAIEKQLHDQKVSGVIALFSGLTPDEKAECFIKLQSLMKH